MILDRLDNAETYLSLNTRFAEAFEFLRSADLAALPDGRHPFGSEGLYAMVMRRDGKGRDGTGLEAHRRYIDIQLSVAGCDCIGWKDAGGCADGSEGYDPDKDMELFSARPEVWIETPPGTFAVFFPQDAHAPMGADESLHKVVVKVPVEH